MLQRIEHDNGVVTYQSPRLTQAGVRHGFTTRLGGISPPPYDSLNLGLLAKGPGSDANTSVAENFRRLRAALSVERVPRFAPVQRHGCGVWDVDDALPVRPEDSPEADAVVTSQPDRLLAVRTADCVPILLATKDGRSVGAVHAGWRGVLAGVVPQAVQRLANEVVVAVGPCISVEHFEVGPEVVAAFTDAGLSEAVHARDGSQYIDLPQAVAQQLTEQGIPAEDVDLSSCCTYRDEAEFFSYRRDVTHRQQECTGHMAAVIAARV